MKEKEREGTLAKGHLDVGGESTFSAAVAGGQAQKDHGFCHMFEWVVCIICVLRHTLSAIWLVDGHIRMSSQVEGV